MKRFHVHMSVTDVDQAVGFYSALFATQPTVRKPDYAKWMLNDPRVNFAVSTRGQKAGLDHLGIQTESRGELGEVRDRLEQAGGPITAQPETTCCYATSAKNWTVDPAGIAWETFFTYGEATDYGESPARPGVACCADTGCGTPAAVAKEKETACCAPA